MEQQVNISRNQLLGFLFVIVMSLATGWMSINQRIKALEVGTEIRLEQLEKQVSQNEDHYMKILSEIQDIKVCLENKQNRE